MFNNGLKIIQMIKKIIILRLGARFMLENTQVAKATDVASGIGGTG